MIKGRHLILVGLPGSGKSTTAVIAARLLGSPVHDLDDTIVSAEGAASVAELFESRGEEWFREKERETMAQLLGGEPAVISSGGGWAAQERNIVDTEPLALCIYLSVSPLLAADRLGDAKDRPLLSEGSTLERLSELLSERERWYRLAGIELDASAAPDVVAEGIVAAARRYAGWH